MALIKEWIMSKCPTSYTLHLEDTSSNVHTYIRAGLDNYEWTRDIFKTLHLIKTLCLELSLSNWHLNYILKAQRNHPHFFINSLKSWQLSIFTIFARILLKKPHRNPNLFLCTTWQTLAKILLLPWPSSPQTPLPSTLKGNPLFILNTSSTKVSTYNTLYCFVVSIAISMIHNMVYLELIRMF